MRGLLALAGMVAVALISAPQAVPQQLGKQLVVDKDKVQCPKAGFTSIQAAVNAADPGDTIKVCPDLYTESVNVNKPSLTLVGSTNANLNKCTTLSAADPTADAIVTGVAYSFSVLNNDVTISGFVVQGAVDGIDTSAAFSGYRVTGNVIQNNTTRGINVLSSGTNPSRVDHNCIRQNGNGLQSETGDLRNALVDHNTSFRNANGGLDFSGAGARAYVTVTQNDSSGNFYGYTMDNSIGSAVTQNTSQSDSIGIQIGGANNGLDVSGNTVSLANVNGISFNQANFIPVFPGPNVGLNVTGNVVSETVGGSGIVAFAGAPNLTLSVLSNNTSNDNGQSGIRLQSLNTNNLVTNNTANINHTNGIHADGATGNTFANNHMSLNVAFDARDDNRPANTWTGNQCTTDFPAGTIC